MIKRIKLFCYRDDYTITDSSLLDDGDGYWRVIDNKELSRLNKEYQWEIWLREELTDGIFVITLRELQEVGEYKFELARDIERKLLRARNTRLVSRDSDSMIFTVDLDRVNSISG